MDFRSCEECRAIYQELRDASLAARERRPRAMPEGLAAWLEQLNEEDCARLRAASGLWKAWRRLQAHRAATGHSLSLLPVPPGAVSNPN